LASVALEVFTVLEEEWKETLPDGTIKQTRAGGKFKCVWGTKIKPAAEDLTGRNIHWVLQSLSSV
jgi:hypothetical protein